MKHFLTLLLAILLLEANGFAQVGGGPPFNNPFAITLEANGNMVVADVGLHAIIRVDATTGDRTILSDATHGNGPNFGSPSGVAVEADGNILASDANRVIRVDPVTGDRTIISDATHGSGPNFIATEIISVEADGNLVVADDGVNAVLRVDPVTGNRTIISGAGHGSGPNFGSPSGVAVEADGNLVVADWTANAVFRVDPVTGDRTIISNASTGSGPAFDNPLVPAVEADGNIVVVDGKIFGSGSVNAVIRVDPITGDRTIVSDATHGSGPDIGSPGGITVAPNGDLLVVSQGVPGVLRIDPVTGDRSYASGGTPTAVEDQSGSNNPQEFSLGQNYPNPFNPSTTIKYQIPESGFVTLKVYDVLGKEVATLVNSEQQAGSYTTNFNALNLTSGIYLYTIKVNDYVAVKKMMLLK